MIEKPKYASPCNHCGLCCRLSLCHVGELAFGTKIGPCPALMESEDGSLCGLVLMEEMTGVEPIVRKQLGIGCGCSMEDDDTTDAEAAAFHERSMRMMFGADIERTRRLTV